MLRIPIARRLTPIFHNVKWYSTHSSSRHNTVADIHAKYQSGKPLTMMTAYDYITAKWVHDSQTDILLVGDSLAMTALGYDSTTDLPFDEFKYHVKSVCRAPGASMVIADMPFGTFEQNHSQGIRNAIELMKLSHRVSGVKVECGPHTKDIYTMSFIKELCQRGIPVMGHIGLTPQRANSLGGFKVQGNQSGKEIRELFETAQRLQDAGCWGLLIECVPHKVATYITENLRIPTVGIGAGNGTSGQVLVMSDMMGMISKEENNSIPRFVKQYENVSTIMTNALGAYNRDVETRTFPERDAHSFKMKETIWKDFLQLMEK